MLIRFNKGLLERRVRDLYFLLVAGASADDTSAWGGAFTFAVDCLPSDVFWNYGSAFIYIMLFAGGAADYTADVGAFTFDVSTSPSNAYWSIGSAY